MSVASNVEAAGRHYRTSGCVEASLGRISPSNNRSICECSKNPDAVPVANSANIGVHRKGKDKVDITNCQKLAEDSGCADPIDSTIGDDPVDVSRGWDGGASQPREAEGKVSKTPKKPRRKQGPIANSNQPETIKGQEPVQKDEAP
jgi:hypothetical protein